MSKKKQKTIKHIPQRTCIGCRKVLPKKGLIRLVRTPEGSVQVDLSGKAAGRGAYIHNVRSCWETALKKGTIARALKVNITAEDRESLISFMSSLPEDTPEEIQKNE